MENVNYPFKVVQPQTIDCANAASIVVPTLLFLRGMLFLQYVNFCCKQIQAPRKSPLSFCLGTIAIAFHLGQVLVDHVVLFQSFQFYLMGIQYAYSLYEALYIFCLVEIILVVQLHFTRLALATGAASTRCVLMIRLSCIVTCIGGLATALEFAKRFYDTSFKKFSPPLIRGKFLAIYILWLACNGSTDGAITFVMVKQLYHHRSSAHQKSLRITLSRLFNVVINTFALTFITAILALLAASVPHFVPNLSVQTLTFCQHAVFVMNGLLSRIYLTSLYCSFGEPRYLEIEELVSRIDASQMTRDGRVVRLD